MKFCVTVSSTYDRWGTMEPIGEAAKLADELGFFGIKFGEHVVRPIDRSGTLSAAGLIWYDPFVLASYLAMNTKQAKLMFDVLVVPYHPPIQTAKQISTLDTLSKGRVILGVGSGWLEMEFQALGISFADRGAIMNEYLEAMRVLWTQDEPSYHGKHVNFSNVAFYPKCVQKPHVPLWIGGVGPRPMRRVVELGAAWAPNKGTFEDLSGGVQWIKSHARAAGRDPASIDFMYRLTVGEPDPRMEKVRSIAHSGNNVVQPTVITPEQAIAELKRYEAAGFTHMSLLFNWEKPIDYMHKLEWIAKYVMPAFKEAKSAAPIKR